MSEEPGLAVPTSVKERRKALKWSQERLAQEARISTTAVHNLEAGKNGFTDKTLAALAAALGCKPVELLMPMRGGADMLDCLACAKPIADDAPTYPDVSGRLCAECAPSFAELLDEANGSASSTSIPRSR